jgi:glutathione S-transferase
MGAMRRPTFIAISKHARRSVPIRVFAQSQRSKAMLRLYNMLFSGNCYKARLVMAFLGTPYERVEVDIDKGETRTPEFLALNANGRIPLLQIAPGDCLAESNAILTYLAHGSRFLPTERRANAAVMQWLFFEQYSHEPNIATVRYWVTHNLLTPEREAQLASKRKQGYAALDVMERELSQRPFFAGDALTVADIALYGYTHVADEGGFDLQRYGAIGRWMARVEATPGYVPITALTGTEVRLSWSDAKPLTAPIR